MVITKNRIKTVLTFAIVAMAVLVLTAATASAAVLTHDATVEVSDDHSMFDVSVFPGKAGYDDGIDSGVFGDGTVLDYRFFNHYPDNLTFNGTGYVDGGADLISEATATNTSDTNGGALGWADVWTTNDPDADPANFTTETIARAQGVLGTVDISRMKSGTLYFIYGSYEDLNTVALTMSGPGQPDILADHTEDPPLVNKAWISSFDFSDAGAYDTISYSYTNTDTDASRARFMGVIVDGVTDPNFPSVDAGPDMIGWSGQEVPLNPDIIEAPGSDWTSLTYLWTADAASMADPNLTVVITDADQKNASVTITKTAPTGDATVVTMTIAVNNEGRVEPPLTSTMTIDVYDNACLAAKATGTVETDPTDVDENCITNLADFAVLVEDWLVDYEITGPVIKP